MALNLVRFFSLLFVALELVPLLAHLLELPNKITMSREEYLIAQQIYSGWALLGIVVIAALISTLVLTIMLRGYGRQFVLALGAFLGILGTQIVFWTYTYPTNQVTRNWTTLPENWMALRAQWEYSHATSAVLNLIAFILLVLCVLSREKP